MKTKSSSGRLKMLFRRRGRGRQLIKTLIIGAAMTTASLGSMVVQPSLIGREAAHGAVVGPVSVSSASARTRFVSSESLFESSSLVLLGIGLLGTANVLRSAFSKRVKRGGDASGDRPGGVIGAIAEPRHAA